MRPGPVGIAPSGYRGMSTVLEPRFRGRFIAWRSIGGLAAPLEVDGGLVTEAGVATVRVIPPFDVLEEGPARLGSSREPVAVEKFAFEGGEEALGHRVVMAVADRAHRWDAAPLTTALRERVRRVIGCPGHSDALSAHIVETPVTLGRKCGAWAACALPHLASPTAHLRPRRDVPACPDETERRRCLNRHPSRLPTATAPAMEPYLRNGTTMPSGRP